MEENMHTKLKEIRWKNPLHIGSKTKPLLWSRYSSRRVTKPSVPFF